MLFPPQGSDNQQEERRPPRPRRPVQREEWWEAESVQVDTTQPKSEQQQSVPSPVSESTQNRPPDSVPVTPLPEPNQEVALIEPSQPTQRPRRMKQKAQRFPQPWQKVSAQKKRRTRDQATQPTTVPRVNPNDTTRIQEGQWSITTVREATAFPEIPLAAHELIAILQLGISYELVEWLARRLQEVSERMAQEHRDQIMIQKTLRGLVNPQEQQEIDRIGRQQSAKNKGEAI